MTKHPSISTYRRSCLPTLRIQHRSSALSFIVLALLLILLLLILLLLNSSQVISQSDPIPKMYWTDQSTNKIQRANVDGSNVEDLITTGLSEPEGIALDTSASKMYWTDHGTDKIQRANLDGSNVEDLVTTGLLDPQAIALDLSAGKMYWADHGTEKIQRANLNGSNVEDLVATGLDAPEGIALDLSAGKMYWTDWDTNKIQRANLNGSNVEDLVVAGLSGPNGIALDIGANKMYWTDPISNKIQRANLNGSAVEDLITTGLDGPETIALDIPSGKMYWADFGTDKIQRANLNGSGVEDLITSGLGNPSYIVLDLNPISTPTPTPTFTPPFTSTFTPVPTSTFTPVPTSTFTPVPTSTFTPLPVPTATHTPAPSLPTSTPPSPTPILDTPLPPTITPTDGSPTPIDTPLPPALPDLLITSIKIELETSGSCAFTATELGYMVTVANNGTALVGSFTLQLNSVQKIIGGGLAAGSSTTVWFAGYSSGTPLASVDPANEIAESDETNNVFTASILPVPTLPPTCTPTLTLTPTLTVTPTPTNTPMPITDTPAPSTDTPIPPTHTPTLTPNATVIPPTVSSPTIEIVGSDSGGPGTIFIAHGSGFTSDIEIILFLNQRALRINTDANGEFWIALITFSNNTPGDYSITDGNATPATFTIEAAGAVEENSAPAGQSLQMVEVASASSLVMVPFLANSPAPTSTPEPEGPQEVVWSALGTGPQTVDSLAISGSTLFVTDRRDPSDGGGIYQYNLEGCALDGNFIRNSTANTGAFGVDFAGPIGLAAAFANGLYYSLDSGDTWINAQGIQGDAYSVAFAGNTAYAAAGERVYRSVDNGITWVSLATINQQVNVIRNISSSLWLGTDGLGVQELTLGNNAIIPQTSGLNSPASLQVWDIYIADLATLYIATYDGVFSGNGFEAWERVGTNLARAEVRALEIMDNTLYAGTRANGIYQTSRTDPQAWVPVTVGTPASAGWTVRDLLHDDTYCNGLLAGTDEGVWLLR